MRRYLCQRKGSDDSTWALSLMFTNTALLEDGSIGRNNVLQLTGRGNTSVYLTAICSRAFSVAVCQPQGINHNPFFWILTFQTPLQLKEWLCDQAVVNEM